MSSSAVAALRAVVDAVVDVPVVGLWPDGVQALLAEVAPQVARLQGWLSRALAELPAELAAHLPGRRVAARPVRAVGGGQRGVR